LRAKNHSNLLQMQQSLQSMRLQDENEVDSVLHWCEWSPPDPLLYSWRKCYIGSLCFTTIIPEFCFVLNGWLDLSCENLWERGGESNFVLLSTHLVLNGSQFALIVHFLIAILKHFFTVANYSLFWMFTLFKITKSKAWISILGSSAILCLIYASFKGKHLKRRTDLSERVLIAHNVIRRNFYQLIVYLHIL
jgi:hypothetical protein